MSHLFSFGKKPLGINPGQSYRASASTEFRIVSHHRRTLLSTITFRSKIAAVSVIICAVAGVSLLFWTGKADRSAHPTQTRAAQSTMTANAGSDRPIHSGLGSASADAASTNKASGNGSTETIAPQTTSDFAKPAQDEDEGPVTATAVVSREKGEKINLKSVDGLFKQVILSPAESIQIDLDLSRFDQSRQIRLIANNGGSINRKIGPTVVDPSGETHTTFTFGVGATTGAYTVEIMQGTRTEMLDFWVGPLPPRGEAGPNRTFTATKQ